MRVYMCLFIYHNVLVIWAYIASKRLVVYEPGVTLFSSVVVSILITTRMIIFPLTSPEGMCGSFAHDPHTIISKTKKHFLEHSLPQY